MTLPDRVLLAIAVVSLLLHLAVVLTSIPLRSANDRSRWCTVWSLAERGTFVIDELQTDRQWQTIDRLNHEGHWYSTKPPLLPAAVAGVYAALKQPLSLDLRNEPVRTTRIVLLVVNWLPWVAAVAAWTRLIGASVDDRFTGIVLATVLGVGTPAVAFCGVLNNHFPAVVTTVLTLPPLLRLLDGVSPTRNAATAAFWAGLTTINELPALALLGLVGLAALRRGVRPATAVVAVAAPLLVAYLAATYVQTGGLKPFYAFYGTQKYTVAPDGSPTYWANPTGLDAADVSTPAYVFHCLLGHHGLLVITPFWLLTVAAWCGLGGSRPWLTGRLFRVGSLLLTLVVLGFYWTRFENYNYGGVTVTLRWALWLVPVWTWAAGPAVTRLGRTTAGRAVIGLLLGASIASALWAAPNPWRYPWVYAWATS